MQVERSAKQKRVKCVFVFTSEAPPILFKDSASREECKAETREMRFFVFISGRPYLILKIAKKEL